MRTKLLLRLIHPKPHACAQQLVVCGKVQLALASGVVQQGRAALALEVALPCTENSRPVIACSVDGSNQQLRFAIRQW